MFESKKNNIYFKLGAGLSTIGNLVVIGEGKEALIEDFTDAEPTKSFKGTIVKFKQGVPYQTEVVNAISKNGKNLIVQRAVELCPMNGTSTELVQNPYLFDEGDIFFMNLTAGDLSKIDLKFNTKLDIDGGIRIGLPINSIIYVNAEGEEDVLEFDPELDNGKAVLIDEILGLRLESPSVNISGLNESNKINSNDELMFNKVGTGNEKITAFNLLKSNIITGILGDTISQSDIDNGNDALYIDVGDFTTPTLSLPIGGGEGSKRIGIALNGNNVSNNQIAVYLSKVGTPTQNLNFRIETDNNGKASGTLIDANAIGTITQASLTTSLANTTITLTGNITIPSKCWIVIFQGTYGSETIDYANYYNIGYSSGDSKSIKLFYDDWKYIGTQTTDTFTLAGSQSTNSFQSGIKILSKNTQYLISVSQHGSAGGTRALLKNNAGTIIDTASVSGGIATFFKRPILLANTNYRIEFDNNGSNYTTYGGYASTFPQNKTNVNFITGSLNGADNGFAQGLTGVVTADFSDDAGKLSVYVSSTLFNPVSYKKTDASNVNKINFIGFARKIGIPGDVIDIDIEGLHERTISIGDIGKDFYLGNTPGSISTTVGTNVVNVGKATHNGILVHTDGNKTNDSIGNISSSFAFGTNYLAPSSGFVTGYVFTSGSTNNASCYVGNTSPAGTLVLKNGSTSYTVYAGFCFPVKKGQYWRVDVSNGSITESKVSFIPNI